MRTRKRFTVGLIAVALGAALLLPSLTATSPAALAQSPALTVIASTSILADVASQVAGDAAAVESLFPLGTNAHEAQPSAQDVARLSDADLVLVVGANYEEGLLPVLEQAGGENVVTVSNCVPIRPVTIDLDGHASEEPMPQVQPNPNLSSMADQCAAHDDEVKSAFGLDEVAAPGALGPLYTLECPGHHEDEEHAEDEHPVGSCDPHMWTDPVNVGLWALMIRDALIASDPAHADTYTSNTAAYLAELATTNQQIVDIVASIPDDHRYIVTNHLTLGYWAARYGLTVIGAVIPSGSTASEPSSQDAIKLIQTIQDYDLPAIFSENVVSDKLAQQIADETGAKVVSLYTESLSQPGDGADTYLNYLLFNASAIADALR
jgi:ABC-type Zn uptake system ZnuABC Zn-binding protein ZnuA